MADFNGQPSSTSLFRPRYAAALGVQHAGIHSIHGESPGAGSFLRDVFWGEAFSRGSFLNGGMSSEQAAAAGVAIRQADALKDTVPAMERALIEATLVRYPANYKPTNRRAVDQGFC